MSRRHHAFTLVELLVVIGIIAVLVGLLLPVMSAARKHARMVVEMSASRQLMQGYIMYTADNRGALIPGHITDNLRLVDDIGNPLMPPEVVKRWPWRLASYLKYAMWGSILVNAQGEALSDRTMPMWSYMLSLTPSFGLNYFNLGGDQLSGGINNAPGCIFKITQASDVSRRIVFVTSRSPGEAGTVEGYFKIVPPTKPFEYSASGWNPAPYDEAGEPAAWGYVHPRHNKRAVVAFLDGHSETLSVEDLRDMTRWSEPASRAANPRWPGTPSP